MTVWFTSDLHLGHRAMAWCRKTGAWPTQEERHLVTPKLVADHDKMLAARWDAVVGRDDVVYGLGDLIANNKSLDAALDWMTARPGRKRWILGNHDPAHPMHSESEKYEKRYREVFESVGMARKRVIPLPNPLSLPKHPGQLVLMSHFPYEGDGEGKEDRCSQWRLPNQGYALLHGHVHSKDKVTYTEDKIIQIHVGVDAWDGYPVSLEQIGELLV